MKLILLQLKYHCLFNLSLYIQIKMLGFYWLCQISKENLSFCIFVSRITLSNFSVEVWSWFWLEER